MSLDFDRHSNMLIGCCYDALTQILKSLLNSVTWMIKDGYSRCFFNLNHTISMLLRHFECRFGGSGIFLVVDVLKR